MSNELVTLPPSVTSRGLDVAMWNTLQNSLFPGAKADSVLMAVDYCKARGLDIMKKPCHIVPIWVKDGMRDVVMAGIYEYRITAHRTKQYLGHDKPVYGEVEDYLGVYAPEWCEMTVKRLHEPTGQVIEYPVRVYFREVCATKKTKGRDGEPDTYAVNERWTKAPIQMLTKCTEAAALREAFPDELGGTSTEDEMYGKVIDVTPAEREQPQDDQPSRSRSRKPPVKEPEAKAAPASDASMAKNSDAVDDTAGSDRIIKSQQTLIEQRLKRANIPTTEFLAQFEINQIDELPFDEMQHASEWIANYNP
jgi:phage recombination protein Bet